VETAVARESRFYVNGDQQVQNRIKHQHEHYVRDAHLVVRRHRHFDIFPSQPATDTFKHDETLEYVSQRRVWQYGRRQDFSVGHG